MKRRVMLSLAAGLAISVAAGLSFGMRAADDVESTAGSGAVPSPAVLEQLPAAATDPLAIDTGHAMAASASYQRLSDCQRLDARFQLGCRRYVLERARPKPAS